MLVLWLSHLTREGASKCFLDRLHCEGQGCGFSLKHMPVFFWKDMSNFTFTACEGYTRSWSSLPNKHGLWTSNHVHHRAVSFCAASVLNCVGILPLCNMGCSCSKSSVGHPSGSEFVGWNLCRQVHGDSMMHAWLAVVKTHGPCCETSPSVTTQWEI